LVWSDLTNANLAKAHFDETILSGSNLSGVDFNDVDLDNCIVYEITLADGQQKDLIKALKIRIK
jgi:uncharacterized protein YjbI with pentapeptide repeats